MWRVGSGEHVRIWQDPLLPTGVVRFPWSPHHNTILNKISELIDPYTHSWDELLVRQTFNPEETDIVLKIPIFEQHEDFLAWQFDSKGFFSVRSAYRVHLDMKKWLALRRR